MSRGRRMPVGYLGILTPVLLVGLWEVLVQTDVLTFDYLPSPSEIAAAVPDLVSADALFARVGHTALMTVAAWLIALVIALALGLVLGLSSRAWRFSMASVEVMRTLPAVALVPVVLLVVGPTSQAEIVVAAYAASWPMLISVSTGVQGTSTRLVEVARQMELSRPKVVFSLMLPSAAPLILAGARLSLGISLIVVVLAEMLGNPQGLGAGIVEMQTALQPENMWAYVIAVALLGTLLNAVLIRGSRLVMPRLLVGGRR